MKADKIQIGLIGYGNVGSGVVEYFRDSKNSETNQYEIQVIGVRDKSKTRAYAGYEVTDRVSERIIQNPEIDIIVDAVGGNADADKSSLDYVRAALKNRKNVVSCNKNNLSRNLAALTALADQNQVNLQYEASVCGGIPIIRALQKYFKKDEITKVVGIVNGTSNYILTQMHNGKDFKDALKEAQEKGYAESDPSSDVNGMDAAYKLAILASIAFKQEIKPEMIKASGIENITHHDFFYVRDMMTLRRKKAHTIKLLAIAERKNNSLELRVGPTFINEDHPIFGANGVLNRIAITGKYSGSQILGGSGAGKYPTGFAVVNDILEIGEKIKRGVVENFSDFFSRETIADNPISRGYIKSTSPEYQPGVFEKKAGVLGNLGIDIRDIFNCEEFENETEEKLVPDMLLIERTTERNIESAIRKMQKINCITGPVVYVREDIA